jgi:hypothetical protein
MSRIIRITTEGEEAVSAATVETLLQFRGVTTLKLEVCELSISADYTTDATGIVSWLLGYQSTDGTGSGASEIPGDPDDPTPAITGFTSFSAEPTPSSTVLESHFNCNGGEVYRYYAEGDGITLDNATSSRLGLSVNSDKACNMKATLGLRVMSG